jgi:hypothetical protein
MTQEELLKAFQRFHDQVHDVAGEALINWRAKLQEHCEEAREVISKATK